MTTDRPLMFGLDDRPPVATSMLAGFQHLLAIFGGIITAPLIIALGMNLTAAETNYLLTSALLISGVATYIQIARVGVFGSGLLAIQGTSFTFIGPILFAFYSLPDAMHSTDKLAIIFGSSAAASLVMMVLSYQLHRIKRLLMPTVTGTTVVLLGATLVWTTLTNLLREYTAQVELGAGSLVILLALLVFGVTLIMSLWRNPWVRLSSIMSGLALGYLVALVLGLLDFSALDDLDNSFVPIPLYFGMGFDWGVFFILLPIFVVSATESIGDLTATSALSGQSTSDAAYWRRVRGGILGDSLNSLIAACFSTFPNTTFSQNNGVIRLTGIASRHIGYVVAVMLVILGFFPIVGGLFQVVPGAVLYGSTLLMFSMVVISGVGILAQSSSKTRDWSIAVAAIVGGWLISYSSNVAPSLPDQLKMILQFPVSTGAFLAMFLELVIPKTNAAAEVVTES